LKLSPVPHVPFALSPDHHLSVGEDTAGGWSTLKLSPACARCSLCQLAMAAAGGWRALKFSPAPHAHFALRDTVVAEEAQTNTNCHALGGANLDFIRWVFESNGSASAGGNGSTSTGHDAGACWSHWQDLHRNFCV
jgi:hypothetical protein